jgi:hypothetical protein
VGNEKPSERAASKELMECLEMIALTPYSFDSQAKIRSLQLSMKVDPDFEEIKYNSDIKASNVLTYKESSKWDWNILYIMFVANKVPIKKLRESTMQTKFVKRLLSHFMYYKSKFPSMNYSPENYHMCEIGYHIIKLLLVFKEGRFALSVPPNDSVFKQKKSLVQEVAELLEVCYYTDGI